MIPPPRSLSGDALTGDRFVRFAYLDESGQSKTGAGPSLVVAGIIIHADRQWKALERRLCTLADECVPKERRKGFYFHANELFHGHGEFSRDRWSREARETIFERLVSIPCEFKLPIVYGTSEGSEYDALYHRGGKYKQISHYAFAYASAAFIIDMWTRLRFPPEVVSIVVENLPEVQAHIKELHRQWQNPSLRDVSPFFPLRRVVDTVHFAAKQDSSLLQIADTCAFVIRRRLEGKDDIIPFYEKLFPQIVLPPSMDKKRLSWRQKIRIGMLSRVAMSYPQDIGG